MWALRWHVGGRMIMWAAWYVLPPSAPRADLRRRVNEWSREWDQKLREAKAEQLRQDVKRTTESWQA